MKWFGAGDPRNCRRTGHGLGQVFVVGLWWGLAGWGCQPGLVAAGAEPLSPPAESPRAKVCSLGSPLGQGMAQAVVVEGAVLAHTAQMFPLDAQGQLVGPDNLQAQTRQVLAHLQKALALVGSSLEDLVRLEIHLTDPASTEKIQALLAEQFTGPTKPVVHWVLTPLPVPGAMVAADAVAVARPEKTLLQTASGNLVVRKRSAELPGLPQAAHVALLPAGGVAYLSGQPEKGEPVAAAKKSLQTLLEMLGQMGLTAEQVVQVKVFLGPMDQAEAVWKELAGMWGQSLAPPMSIVQWKSSAPVEIELVASDPPQAGQPIPPPVHYYNPPGTKPSPRFSRATRVRSDKIIYIGTLASPQPAPADQQVEALFGQLEKLLEQTGSDLRHLVKATYYCADEPSSKALDLLRSKKFDPTRPPAASKAMVSGVAIPQRNVVLDMIAVPKLEK